MDSNLSNCSVRVFSEVLEHLAFMFADVVPKDEMSGLDGDGVRVAMEFSGPLAGTLTLAAPESTAAEIAANILGVDAEDLIATRGAEDALKEVLNVACGRLLTALEGEGPVFRLTVPEASPINPSEWAALLSEEETLAFQADGQPLLLRVRLNPEG